MENCLELNLIVTICVCGVRAEKPLGAVWDERVQRLCILYALYALYASMRVLGVR